MRSHKWYMAGRQITVHDIYSFDPDVHPELEEFEDVIGRNFKQPEQGLGFDNSPVAHMWRAMIRAANYLEQRRRNGLSERGDSPPRHKGEVDQKKGERAGGGGPPPEPLLPREGQG